MNNVLFVKSYQKTTVQLIDVDCVTCKHTMWVQSASHIPATQGKSASKACTDETKLMGLNASLPESTYTVNSLCILSTKMQKMGGRHKG